jgi:hypothetical protein
MTTPLETAPHNALLATYGLRLAPPGWRGRCFAIGIEGARRVLWVTAAPAGYLPWAGDLREHDKTDEDRAELGEV